MGVSQVENASRIKRPMLRKAAAICEHLLGEVSAGRLKPGAVLPPEIELAKTFGVSRQTVRRALAEMDEEGIIRREQGRGTFVSQGACRQLQQGVNSFALLIPRLLPTTIPMLSGFQKACQSAQGHPVLYDSGNSLDTQASIIMGILYGGVQISGVAMLPPTTPPTPFYHVTALQERGIPVVFCHRGVSGARAPTVALPYEEMGRMAANAAVELGHRRLGLFHSFKVQLLDRQILGFRKAVRAHDGDLPERFVFAGPTESLDLASREKEAAEAVGRMVAAEDRPTAIWVASGQDAELVYGAVRRSGLRVPEDISLLTTILEPDPLEPFLQTVSGVFVPDEEVGSRALKVLCEMRCGKRPLNDEEEIMVPIRWRQGRTLGRAP
jgi:GntR family transcriptional regulator, arabinose operon transcriptional repressor